MINLKKIFFVIFLTLALLSSIVLSAEEVSETSTAIITANPYISQKQLNLMLQNMTIEELFVEADGWLVLLNAATEKVYDTELSVQEKNKQIDALKVIDNNQTVAEEREAIQQKITMTTEEKAAIVKKMTKLRAERKIMVACLDTVLKNINERYKASYTNRSNHTLDIGDMEDLDECEELSVCEDQS